MKPFWNKFGGSVTLVAIVFAAAFILNTPTSVKYNLETGTTVSPEAQVLLEKKIDINSSSEGALTAVPGIGKTTAKKIVEFRNKNGRFDSIEELDNVRGVGEKTIEKIRPYVEVR